MTYHTSEEASNRWGETLELLIQAWSSPENIRAGSLHT